MKLFDYINCVCCGFKINLSKDRFIENNSDFDPESQMWSGGIVQKISAGYGSTLDGDQYYLGICDNCVKENTENGRLRYGGDYLFHHSKYTDGELKKFDRIRNRGNNLNDILPY